MVQLALEIMWCLAGSYFSWFTPMNDGDVFVLAWGGNDDFLRAGLDVAFSLLLGGEESRRLDDEVHAETLPRQFGRALGADDLDLLAVDDEDVGSSSGADFFESTVPSNLPGLNRT